MLMSGNLGLRLSADLQAFLLSRWEDIEPILLISIYYLM